MMFPQSLGISRQIIRRPLGQNFALVAHRTIDAVKSRLSGERRGLLEIKLQFLIHLAEDADRRRKLAGRRTEGIAALKRGCRGPNGRAGEKITTRYMLCNHEARIIANLMT